MPVFNLTLPAWTAQRPAHLAPRVQQLQLAEQGAVLRDCFVTRDLILVLATEAQVQSFAPDFAVLRQLQPYHALILTAPWYAADGHTVIGYVLRYFAPAIGIDEDIATGSAQCSLAPYWLARAEQQRLQVRQLSAGGGYFQVQACQPGQIRVAAAVRMGKSHP